MRKKLIFRQNHLWITPFLTNHFHKIFYQFYIPCTRLQSCRHHLTLIFDKSFSSEFQCKIFYFFGIFSWKIQYFGPKIVKNYQFTWFCSQRSIFKSKLSPKKERSIRKYGKSPNEVSFFERSITGHPVLCGIWALTFIPGSAALYNFQTFFNYK